MRTFFATALALTMTTPAAATIIGQETVTASGGSAELNYGGPLTDPTTIWVGVDRGQIDYGAWEHFGYETILWWDPQGGGYDGDGNPIPAITGNDYFIARDCGSSPASPVCGGGPVQTLLHNNVLRQIFLPPKDS